MAEKINSALQLETSVDEFRERALGIAHLLENEILKHRPIWVAETLVALHIVRVHLESELALSELTPERQALLLTQVQYQRDSFDRTVAAERARPKQ